MLHVVGIDAGKELLSDSELAREALDGNQAVIGGAGVAEEAAQSVMCPMLNKSSFSISDKLSANAIPTTLKSETNFFQVLRAARGVHVDRARGAVEGEGFGN